MAGILKKEGKKMTEESILSGQLTMGKKVLEMYFDLVQDKQLESVKQDLSITGEDFILELRKVEK